jgi:hypothetical protein
VRLMCNIILGQVIRFQRSCFKESRVKNFRCYGYFCNEEQICNFLRLVRIYPFHCILETLKPQPSNPSTASASKFQPFCSLFQAFSAIESYICLPWMALASLNPHFLKP